MDKLEQIIKKQKDLCWRIVQERNLDYYFNDVSKMLEKHVLAIKDENAELLRETDWKPWVNDRDVDIDACKEELIDILHFNLQALILLGCDANEIYQLYMGKNKENHARQDGNTDRKGYDVNSDEQYENVD